MKIATEDTRSDNHDLGQSMNETSADKAADERSGSGSDPITPNDIEATDSPADFASDDVLLYGTNAARPFAFYADLEIGGRLIRALVDSGATRTFAGKAGIELISSLGIPAKKIPNRRVTVANNQVTIVNLAAELPIRLGDRTTQVETLCMPSLSEDFVIGFDFLQAARMVIDFFDKTWCYRDEPTKRHSFVPAETAQHVMCNGLRIPQDSEAARLQKFLKKKLPVTVGNPPVSKLSPHKIDVGDTEPIRQRAHRMTERIREVMWKAVDKMLSEGIIEPSGSDWASAVVMVKKPNNEHRFCVDYRAVNAVTKKDAYPLPNMAGILDELRQANYLTTLDLSQAYWQIPLSEESKPITTFTVPGRGLFQFTRMPYGLTNAPATFQRALDRLLGPELYPHVFVYLDDIIIVTKTFDEHLHWLGKVLDKLNGAGLVINQKKSKFCCPQVKYLGFVVDSNGLRIDSDKTAAVLEFPVPKTVKQLRRFLGMASWYRRFIPDFATIAEPLTRLTKKNQSWDWGDAQQDALDALKKHLTSAPTLACPDFSLPYTLQTDASGVGLGAVLTQNIDGQERVIAYASRTLSDPEKKYSVTEQECLAVVWSISKFRCYLEGYTFTVITDHSSLRWLHNLKDPTGRLARWALGLMEYDFKIVHRKGALHHVPDALSRAPMEAVIAIIERRDTKDKWYLRRYRDVERAPDKFPLWQIVEGLLYHHKRSNFAEAEFVDLDAWKLVLPRESRHVALQECHELPQAGHQGIDRTYKRLSTQYYWSGMLKDVTTYVSHCNECQRCKVEQQAPAGLMGRRVIEKPWTVISADIMGPLTPSKGGLSYVLVIQDLYTKWIELCPLRRATGATIRKAIEDLVINRWGTPKVLVTDNGTEFVNKDIKALTEITGMRQTTTPPYHPQANPTERVNRTLKMMIRAFLDADHREWDMHLQAFRFAYNTAHHSSINATPAFANFGREPEPAISLKRDLEGDPEVVQQPPEKWLERMKRLETLRTVLKHALGEAHDRQSHQYNKRRRDLEYVEGELVLARHHELSNAAKHRSAALSKPFDGPYMIAKKLSKTVYELVDLAGKSKGKMSIQDIKPYKPELPHGPCEPDFSDDSSND